MKGWTLLGFSYLFVIFTSQVSEILHNCSQRGIRQAIENNRLRSYNCWTANASWWWNYSWSTARVPNIAWNFTESSHSVAQSTTVRLDFQGFCVLSTNSTCQQAKKATLGNQFENAIFTDEVSVQIETHRRRCYRKKGQKPRNKPRPKHSLKVHVWAGISKQGATSICIFTGTMDAELYVNILDRCLVPFVRAEFSSASHRFMQDNDPKHVSRRAQKFFEENNKLVAYPPGVPRP